MPSPREPGSRIRELRNRRKEKKKEIAGKFPELSPAHVKGLAKLRYYSAKLEIIKRTINELNERRAAAQETMEKKAIMEEIKELERKRSVIGTRIENLYYRLSSEGVKTQTRKDVRQLGTEDGQSAQIRVPETKKRKAEGTAGKNPGRTPLEKGIISVLMETPDKMVSAEQVAERLGIHAEEATEAIREMGKPERGVLDTTYRGRDLICKVQGEKPREKAQRPLYQRLLKDPEEKLGGR